MDVASIEALRRHRLDCLGLGDLLCRDALLIEHVHEIGVAAEIQLIGAVERHPAPAAEICQRPMDDGGAKL
jgi:hypothetical protein